MAEATILAGERYEVQGQLGEGGMGAVYLVKDQVRGETLALKVMAEPGGPSEASFLRFKQEFRMMAGLSHPGLCAVYDFGRLPDSTPYFTMELVPGQELQGLAPMDPAALLPMLAQLCAALGYLHQQGYVHLDLKPENIRLKPDGSVKLMDFGLMAPAGQALDAVRGTLAYVSPEVAKRDRIDQRSDLYSLGAVLYELLTGTPPFQHAGALQLLRAHLTEPPRPIQELRPELPEGLARVVMKLLAKEPSARFQSAGAVLAALGLGADEAGQQGLLASSFIGRRDALAALHAHKTGLLQLVGPEGIGKSRLLGELRFQVQLDERPYFEGECPPVALPYGPWIAVLRALLPLAKERCPQLLADHGPNLGKLLPELATGEPLQLEPDQEKLLIQTAIAQLLLGVTGDGAVLVLEHWERADGQSSEVLGKLAHAATGKPLAIIVASQTAGQLPGQTLALTGLARDEVRAMIEAMLGQAGLPERLVEQIHELTEGNPQLVATALEHALAAGAIARSGERWDLPAELPAEALAADVERLAAERLDRLPVSVYAVARALAVLGRSFELPLAAGVLGMSDELLFDSLATLVQARVLDQTGTTYRFTVPELVLVLAGELREEERTRLHLQAAAWLEARFPEAGDPPLADLDSVARHYVAAGAAEAGTPRVIQAFRRLCQLYAFKTADELLVAGAHLLDALPDEPAWRTVRCDYHQALSEEKRRRNQLERSLQHGEAALALARELGDGQRELVARVSVAQTHGLEGTPEGYRLSMQENDQAVELASRLGNWGLASRAASAAGRSALLTGDQATALRYLESAVKVGERAPTSVFYGRALAKFGHALASYTQDRREEGVAALGAAAKLQVETSDKYGESLSENMLGDLLHEGGRFPEALRSLQRFLQLTRDMNTVEDLAVALLGCCLTRVELGAYGEAAVELAEVERSEGAQRSRTLFPIARALKALVATGRGLPEAENLLHEATAGLAGVVPYAYRIALPLLTEGWLALGLGQTALAMVETAEVILGGKDEHARRVLAICAAETLAWLGRWDAARAKADEALASAQADDARGVVVRALRVQAACALAKGDLAAAHALIERGQAQAAAQGMLPLQTAFAGLAGELALREDRRAALAPFQTMQALADQMGMPLLRARALYGQARANAQAGGLLDEARQAIATLEAPMSEEARDELRAAPEVKALLAGEGLDTAQPAGGVEGSRQIGERFGRVQQEIQGLAAQYDMLFDDWQASNAQLRQLNELAARMNESLHVEEVLQQVVALTLEITRAERGFIVLKGQGRYEDLVCRAAFDREGAPLAPNAFSLSICHKVLAADKAIAVLDASADADFASAKSVVALDIKTVMGTPLITKGKRLGVLYVDSQAVVATFTEKDLELLRAIASHASVAIENATLYESLDSHARELEEALALYRKAEKDASTDLLTGLANRRAFREAAGKEIGSAQRHGRPLSLIMLDVDHFKQFNDTYGHAVGDDVLKAMGRVLPTCVRISDLPARLGGEEFVVLCPDTPPEDALALAERIREAILEVQLTDAEGRPVRQLTASLGIAQVQPTDAGIDEALERADIALYACKRGGRNQSQIWRPDMPSAAG